VKTKDELWWCSGCFMWAPSKHKARPAPLLIRAKWKARKLLHAVLVRPGVALLDAIFGLEYDDTPAVPPPEGYRKNWTGGSWANPDDEVDRS